MAANCRISPTYTESDLLCIYTVTMHEQQDLYKAAYLDFWSRKYQLFLLNRCNPDCVEDVVNLPAFRPSE